MKIGIVGSRTFNDYNKFLDIFIKFNLRAICDTVVSGGAKGADSLGKRWAKYWGLEYVEFKPDWDKYGKIAGFIRNQTIVDNSDMIVAFWDGKSKGTQDTITKAKKAKKLIITVSI